MDLTHFNEDGLPRMVDVSEKETTKRVAVAHSRIYMKKETMQKITEKSIKKGDVLSVAQTAAIMAAKKTSEIIPMCHNIFITGVDVKFELADDFIDIFVQSNTESKTGIEMESLTAASVAALTIYDMCKAIDRSMRITNVELLHKKGTVKTPVEFAELKVDHGLVGDAHAGNWHRQVSLLAEESINKMREMGLDLKDGDFAENITTRNIELFTLPVSQVLTIGECVLEVTQIGKECHKGCAIKQKVGNCIMPTEGIFCKVLKGGIIKKNDKIKLVELN